MLAMTAGCHASNDSGVSTTQRHGRNLDEEWVLVKSDGSVHHNEECVLI